MPSKGTLEGCRNLIWSIIVHEYPHSVLSEGLLSRQQNLKLMYDGST